MADANLLEALNKNKGRIDNIVVFGRVRCAIKNPNLLGKSVEVSEKEGFFAIVDAYALKCLDVDYFGDSYVRDANKLYFTRGSMVVFIDDKKWIGKDVKIYKRGSSGVTIKRQWYSKTMYDGVTAFVFVKGNGNGFKIVPNKLVELGKNDSDVRGTTLQDFIVSVVVNKEGVIEYPITLDTISQYEGVLEYEELQEDEIAEATPPNTFIEDDERVDVTKIDLHLTYHLSGAKRSEFSGIIEDEVKEMSKARKKYATKLITEIGDLYRKERDEDDFDYAELGHKGNAPVMRMYEVQRDLKRRFVANIASKDAETIGNSKLRGNFYVGEFLKCAREGSFSGMNTEGVTKDMKAQVRESIENLAGMVHVDPSLLMGDAGFGDIPLLRNELNFATVVMALMMGKDPEDFSLSQVYMSNMYNVDANLWFYMLIRNPYLLGMLSPGFKLVDCDVIYLSFSRFYSKDCLTDKNMDIRANLTFLENLSEASDKDTLIKPSVLKSTKSKYPAMATKYFNNFGFPAKQDAVEAIRVLLGAEIKLTPRDIEKWMNMSWYSEDRLEMLSDNGVIEIINDDLMLSSDMEKEFMIYDVLIDKGHTRTGISDNTIEETIEEFEDSRGFQLEKLQKDGIKLTKFKAGVLSGCAGSGKTTTSDCMVEVLKKLDNFEHEYDLIFCTPTGKACRRLAEVVGGTVRTIHSQFGVFMGGSSYMAPVSKKRVKEDKRHIYLLDEMAMCSMPLLYEICRSLGDDDLIYFLGDCKQLPPIGKGNPFALLMKILPCVELGVSKRAAEGSTVNYNTTLINCMSDGYVRELSYNENDFFCRECSDAVIPMEVVKCWKGFMEGTMGGKEYEEDDIQVITGYQKEDIVFSVPHLNPPIQRLLRSNDRLLFRHTTRQFYNNDRVIHLRINDYSMNRYIEEAGDTYMCMPTFGMVNGEMGKLIGVVRSDMVNIVGFNPRTCVAGEGYYENLDKDALEELIEKREAKEDDLRDDTKIKNNRMYFVKVKVYDVDLRKDVIVLYRASARVVDGETVLEGSDLLNLDLAYALTTHKMQGSQSPVVILPFGSSCNPTFINRNMLNTMVTRSQGTVCVVGSVKGADSPINRGRKFVSPMGCSDLLTVLSNS